LLRYGITIVLSRDGIRWDNSEIALLLSNIFPLYRYPSTVINTFGLIWENLSITELMPKSGDALDQIAPNEFTARKLITASGMLDIQATTRSPLATPICKRNSLRALGCKLEAYNEMGQPVSDEVGEMVISQAMPSMPVYFWNDPEFTRYKESYFEMFPGKWRHGDWIRITKRSGVIIYGRSDATLNRGGIRIGTAEIYRVLDKVPEITDSIIICVDKEEGEFFMPLFVVTKDGIDFDDHLKREIRKRIKKECSPRHVPDEIIQIDDIPYTISGKKMETPVKKILMGQDVSTSLNRDALKNPGSLDFFIEYAKSV